MEFVDGRSLTEELRRGGPLSERRGLAIAADIAGALAHAHQAGVIHRDIKGLCA
jgi:serine/threonine-protein kinase